MLIFKIINASLLGIIAYYYYKNYIITKKNRKYIDILRNGLLSYALMKVNKDDIDNLKMNYDDFDGNKLPMFSGYNTANACMSYIQDKNDFRNGLFYSKHMENKLNAIDKYLLNKFDTDAKIIDFFDKFINIKKIVSSDSLGTNSDEE